MKTIKYKYDEGYGCGEHEFAMKGWTVDEIIKRLSTYSGQGYGDTIVFDGGHEPVNDIYLKHEECLDKLSVFID